MKNKLSKLTLINKKTKRVASSHHWWLALGAHAHLLGDTQGIAGLLPHIKGQKILQNNFLTLKNKRPGNEETHRTLARQQAYLILPKLEHIYRSNLRSHQRFLKRNFCLWIKNEINKPSTLVNQLATAANMFCIVEQHHSVRWWMDQIKKNAELSTATSFDFITNVDTYQRSCSDMENVKSIRTLRMKDLPAKVGFQPSTIYGLIAQGKFPKPYKLTPGGRAAGWQEIEIDTWITKRVEDQS